GAGHVLIDLGADAFTRGRPHPMIDHRSRQAALREAQAETGVGVILLDVILGWGSHADPAGELVRALAGSAREGPLVVASVTGPEDAPQVRSAQVRRLEDAGVVVAPSNAAAAGLACQCSA